MKSVFAHTDFGLDPDAGLDARPDPREWAYVKLYLNKNARQLYLYMRDRAANGARHFSLKQAAQDIGSTEGARRWEGEGPVSPAQLRRALVELDDAGLTQTNPDEGEPWDA